jgi:hypothetical protein
MDLVISDYGKRGEGFVSVTGHGEGYTESN